jgi:hypothetical protein
MMVSIISRPNVRHVHEYAGVRPLNATPVLAPTYRM